MSTFLVSLKGGSYRNEDGSSRQEIIKTLKINQNLTLVAEPMNEFDRHAVAVFTSTNKQIGYLPSSPRDSSSLLRGETVEAKVHNLTGGVNWFSRYILGKKSIGVTLKIIKDDNSWIGNTKNQELARYYDSLVEKAIKTERDGFIQDAIWDYMDAIKKIRDFTSENPTASANRRRTVPINRLSLLLEKDKRYKESLDEINQYLNNFDPIQLKNNESEAILKRKKRLEKKLN